MWYIHMYTRIQKKRTYSIYMYMIPLWQYVTALPRTQCNMAITHREQLPYINLYMYMYMYTHIYQRKNIQLIYIYINIQLIHIYDTAVTTCHGAATRARQHPNYFTHRQQLPHIYTHIQTQKYTAYIYMYKYTAYTYIWYCCDNMSTRCHEGKATSQ